MNKIYSLLISAFILFSISTTAQETKEKPKEDKFRKTISNGIKIKLNESGSSFTKVIIGLQFWYRSAQLNPGSTDMQTGESISSYQDFVTRRARIISYTNIEDRFYMWVHYGSTNSASYDNLQKGMFFHDFWGKLRIAKNTYVGGGLHMWSGLSRYTMVGGLIQMSLDFPVTQFPNVNVNNQLNRQYGVFLQGRVSNFDYVFSVNQMMMPATSKFLKTDDEIATINKPNVAYNRRLNGFTYKGYVSYSFLNKERLSIPFKSMTYHGKKGKIFNIGAGFNFAADASGAIENAGDSDVKMYDQLVWSADVFYETPLANKSSLTLYGVYYNANYGPNYLKKVAVMGGFASGGTSLNGAGIAEFNFGTGDMAYASVGYLLPKNWIPGKNGLMPYYSAQYRNFDGLNQASLQHDFGLNYLIVGNKVKLTAQYSTRPIYGKTTKEVDEYKGMFIMQMQLRI
jgi:hypothetical protein